MHIGERETAFYVNYIFVQKFSSSRYFSSWNWQGLVIGKRKKGEPQLESLLKKCFSTAGTCNFSNLTYLSIIVEQNLNFFSMKMQ